MSVYAHPHYYEIAFGFRDVPQEVRFFEEAMARFSRVQVAKVLELASGPSPYLEEWHRRGVRYVGLDQSRPMLAYVRRRASKGHIPVELFQGDLRDFRLGGLRVDLAYVLLGSLFLSSNEELLEHLDCVARVLKRGGLYVLDEVVWFRLLENRPQRWTLSRDGITVRCSVSWRVVDAAAQTFQECILLNVNDRGRRMRLAEKSIRKFFFPQEFLTLVKCHGKFVFCGWFDDFDLGKPATEKGRQIVVLRKK